LPWHGIGRIFTFLATSALFYKLIGFGILAIFLDHLWGVILVEDFIEASAIKINFRRESRTVSMEAGSKAMPDRTATLWNFPKIEPPLSSASPSFQCF